jgi:16S rRNA A1518/A1519 N6-dimethyltransferase RsmA/KsgA/DIM1 with predicted DNA glycosylase/AP lyase activity
MPHIEKERVVSALSTMGLDEKIRGERLSTEQFATLANLLSQ